MKEVPFVVLVITSATDVDEYASWTVGPICLGVNFLTDNAFRFCGALLLNSVLSFVSLAISFLHGFVAIATDSNF